MILLNILFMKYACSEVVSIIDMFLTMHVRKDPDFEKKLEWKSNGSTKVMDLNAKSIQVENPRQNIYWKALYNPDV